MEMSKMKEIIEKIEKGAHSSNNLLLQRSLCIINQQLNTLRKSAN